MPSPDYNTACAGGLGDLDLLRVVSDDRRGALEEREGEPLPALLRQRLPQPWSPVRSSRR